ncbi:MAG TPA: (d)CMP kinase, partial [Dehalococcoidia bacterium]|nr:(d)CMP kinase [Dehalococcoidia bacterium]
MKGDLGLSLIAIDGPVAVGKSSVGRLLARRLDFVFFDTGFMYRAFTWKVLRLSIPPDDAGELSQLASVTRFDFVPCQEGYLSVLIDGKDVSSEVLCPEIE